MRLVATTLVLAGLACGCSQEAGTSADVAPPPLTSAAAPSSGAPTEVQQVLLPAAAGARTPDELGTWARSSAKTPVRYAALRELERQDSARAVEVATELLEDPEAGAFLRQNAIAVLVRVGSKEAEAALESLSDATERSLASRLSARAGR